MCLHMLKLLCCDVAIILKLERWPFLMTFLHANGYSEALLLGYYDIIIMCGLKFV